MRLLALAALGTAERWSATNVSRRTTIFRSGLGAERALADDPPPICYAKRYPDLFDAFCRRPGGCDKKALHGHWASHHHEKRVYGCGPPTPECCTRGGPECSRCMQDPAARKPGARARNRPTRDPELWKRGPPRPLGGPFRVAVCFWGVNRSLNRTIGSIRQMLFSPLEEAGATVDVFFHTYTIKTVSSEWAREVNAAVGGPFQEFELFNEGPKRRVAEWSATNQQLFDEETDYAAFMPFARGARGKGFNYRQGIVANVIRAGNSLKRVTLLWMAEAAGHSSQKTFGSDASIRKAATTGKPYYSHVVYARPDLRYSSPIDVALLRNLGPRELYTPAWACWGNGFNDRFAAGPPAAAAIFGLRVDLAYKLHTLPADHAFRKRGLHAENFLRTALETGGVQPRFTKVPCGNRVRSDNRENTRDCLVAPCFRGLTSWRWPGNATRPRG